MRFYKKLLCAAMALLAVQTAGAKIEGSLDPDCVVEQWSNASTHPKVIDINFSDETWPDTWKGETGRDCPSYSDGGYANTIINVPANGGTSVKYPVLFHNCTFANKNSAGGFGGATAAFSRQYYVGEKPSGNSASTYNNWTVAGHKNYLEDNIVYTNGKPTKGEAGFVQMCRDAAQTINGVNTSMHGWMEIDHIPYVERIQWSWSSTSWGRGIKCDIKIGDGEWKPLVWMGSDKHKQGFTVFSDQGYFMENIINAEDVSLRWRVWDGERAVNPTQTKPDGSIVFASPENPMGMVQATRVHKIQIFGNEITAEQAEYAKNNPLNNVGEITDFGGDDEKEEAQAPDADAPIVMLTVAQDGSGTHTKVQDAINAVPDGSRGIIYIKAGVYEENIYAGTKSGKNKFISLIGENRETTILTSSVSRGEAHPENSYNDCAALNVYVQRFYAENLTIRNTAGNVGQAEALFTSGDAHVFNNCRLSGFQDTYKAGNGSRGYFANCIIEGATDFIYDGGLEWFEDCEIRCLTGGQYITAAADATVRMTKTLHPELSADMFYAGLFFRNCNITAATGVANSSYYLGRPWKEQCGTMFIQCTLGSHIKSEGWAPWGGTEDNCSYYEYKNINTSGQLVNTANRVAFGHQATDKEMEAYMTPEYLFAKASDVPFDYKGILGGTARPMNFSIGETEITWEGDDNTVGYIIYKDGAFAGMTTEDKLTKDATDNAEYAISSISRHGVTSIPVKAAEATQLLAFPTAEGFGKYATGGRGGKVVTVTSLADDGSQGTLRWALKQYPGEPLTVVFAVSGQIKLNSELSIKRADWTLAGQTAPGEGIVITHNKVNVGGSQNFIVRNIRFRCGQRNAAGEILADQSVGAENCSNFIFDRCNFGWSVEENMNTQDSHFLTVQYSIVHEGLYNAGHHKGARGYGAQWGGSPATYHHNLLANNKSRSPRINGARGEDCVVFMEYINNVNYNFDGNGGVYGGENTAPINEYNGLNSAHECNFMNNYYKPGPESNTSTVVLVNSSYARDGATSWAPAKWYVNGNVIEGNTASTADNWKAMSVEGSYTLNDIRANERIVTKTPYYRYSVAGSVGNYIPSRYMMYNIETAQQAFSTVMAKAGTINRDKVEERIIKDAKAKTVTYTGSVSKMKGIIDLESDAEGFYPYSTDYTVPADTDKDGMPDEWEEKNGLAPNVADNNKVNKDGYTALEVYLNSIMGETMDNQFTSAIAVAMDAPAMRFDSATSTLFVSENAIGAELKVYTTDARLIGVQRIAATQVSLAGFPDKVIILQVEGKGLAPRVMKVRK